METTTVEKISQCIKNQLRCTHLKLFWTPFHNNVSNYITCLVSYVVLDLVFVVVVVIIFLYSFPFFNFLFLLNDNLQYDAHGTKVEFPK